MLIDQVNVGNAGIGGLNVGTGQNITINGGTVNATGERNGSGIGVNFYLNFDASARQNVDSATVTYKTFSGETMTETYRKSDLALQEDGSYKLTVWIAPAQLADVITVNIGGTEYEQSVLDYCNTLIEGDYPAKYQTVASSLKQYAQAAKTYFNYGDPDDVIDTPAVLDPTEAKGWESKFAVSQNEGDTILERITGVSLLGVAVTEYRFYMDIMDN